MSRKPATKRKHRRVFLSFASGDREIVERLRSRLVEITERKVRFYFAPRDIPLGTNWQTNIERNLKSADCVLLVLSPISNGSRWVFFEAGFAYGKKRPAIPVGIGGYQVENERPPISSLQGITVASVADLNEIVVRLGRHLRLKFTKTFSDLDYLWILGSNMRQATSIVAQALLTRPSIYREVTRLVEECKINAEVKATSTIFDPDDPEDPDFTKYLETLARKCGASRELGGKMTYHLVIGVGYGSGTLPAHVVTSLTRRADIFYDAGALESLEIFRIPDEWTLNLLLVDRRYAVIGFPEKMSNPSLQHGMYLEGDELVARLVEWFDNCVEGRGERLDPRTFLTPPRNPAA